MAKKIQDINLFKAASKSDRKIQTGVSKSAYYVLAVIVLIGALGGMMYWLISSKMALETEAQVWKDKFAYTKNINALEAQIASDKKLLDQITYDKDAIKFIKTYTLKNSLNVPGLSVDQVELITKQTYNQSYTGCLPANCNFEQLIYTDGATKYYLSSLTPGVSNQDFNLSSQDNCIIPKKGYAMIIFNSTNPNAGIDYIQNLLNFASNGSYAGEAINVPFACEQDTELDYSMYQGQLGIKVEDKNGVSYKSYKTPKYYVIFKLKSIDEIIMTDVFLKANTINEIDSLSIGGKTIDLEIKSKEISTSDVCDYFKKQNIFEDVKWNGEKKSTISENGSTYDVYTAKITLTLKNKVNIVNIGGVEK